MCRYIFWLQLAVILTSISTTYGQEGHYASSISGEELKEVYRLQNITDPKERTALARQFLEKYPKSGVRGLAYIQIVSGLIESSEYDLAIEQAEIAIQEESYNLTVMADISRMVARMASAGDFKHVSVGQKMANKALELLSSGVIPYEYSGDVWMEKRNEYIGSLQKNLALILYCQKAWLEAEQGFADASRLLPEDPYSVLMIAKSRYNRMAAGRKLNIEDILPVLARAYLLSNNEAYGWLRPSIEEELRFFTEALKPAQPLEVYLQAAREELIKEKQLPDLKVSPIPK